MSNYIEKDNQDCIFVYNELLAAFNRCEPFATPYLNLVGVFFHELIRILTGYVLKRNELDGPYEPSERQLESTLKEYPYIDYIDVTEGVQIEDKDFSLKHSSISNKQRLFSALSGLKLFNLKKGKRIAFAKPAINLKTFLSKSIKSVYKIKFPASHRIHIPNIKPQLAEIGDAVEKIFNELGLSGNHKTMHSLITKHILMYCSLTETNRIDYDLVVSGTLLEINNRILAAKSRSESVPVITLAHGECEGVIDEPIFGYGDRTYSDIFIGYGKSALKAYENSCYTNTLYEPAQYIQADSNIVRGLYKGVFVEPLGDTTNRRLMYVPTSMDWRVRYGPFRDIPEQTYAVWQNSLNYEFPDMIFKTYSKENRDHSLLPPKATLIDSKRFEECMDKADVFVFDYVSSAFAIAAATSRSIIYLNIGCRNFSESAREKINKRCLWIDVDPSNPGNLRDMVESLKDKRCVNEFTESFSLKAENDGSSREDVLFDTINRVIGGGL